MKSATKLAHRSLGKTGINISEIGFGGWGIGKAMWGRTDDLDSQLALRIAIERGVNYFDTAAVYGHGHSERIIARVVREMKADVVIGTKVPPKNMEWPAHSSTHLGHAFPADWVIDRTQRSLRNLRTEKVDLLMFHVWSDAWLKADGWEDTWRAFERLKSDGKVRAVGVSVNSDDPDSALKIVESGLIDMVQVIVNLFDQRATQRLLPMCKKKKVGVVVRCPFDEGGLTGMLTPETRFEPDDFRSFYFGEDRLPETCRRADALSEVLVGKHAETLAAAALKFCLSFPEVSSVIPGMRTKAHVESNVSAANARYFDPALLDNLKKHAWVRDFYR